MKILKCCKLWSDFEVLQNVKILKCCNLQLAVATSPSLEKRSFFIGPWKTWSAIYGCAAHVCKYNMVLRVNWCYSGWWRYIWSSQKSKSKYKDDLAANCSSRGQKWGETDAMREAVFASTHFLQNQGKSSDVIRQLNQNSVYTCILDTGECSKVKKMLVSTKNWATWKLIHFEHWCCNIEMW